VKKMTVVFHKDNTIWSQFEGYEDLRDMDFDAFKKKNESIERMDRILKAANDSPDNYKISKQPDVCMLFYLLTTKELKAIFEGLGYPFKESMIEANIQYYLPRTTHGSTLSKMIFSNVLQPYDKDKAWDMFMESVRSDIDDSQGGTTGEGIHMALMGGSLYTVIRMYAGVDTSNRILRINPELPKALKKIKFFIQFRGVLVDIKVSHSHIKITSSWNFFPIIIQGVTMLATAKEFKKRIKHQPNTKDLPKESECAECKAKITIGDNQICRSCGQFMCDSCLKRNIGWYNMLIPEDPKIRVCGTCADGIDQNDNVEKHPHHKMDGLQRQNRSEMVSE